MVDPVNAMGVVGRAPRRLTWGQIADEVDRMTAVLHAAGVRRDDVVVVQLPNIGELTSVYLACARLGVIVTPAPAQYRESELAHIVARTDAVAAITAARIGKHAHGEMLTALKTRCPSLNDVFVLGGAPDGAIDLDGALHQVAHAEIAAAHAAAKAAQVTADDVVTICWTSGTEAEPKGVPRSHNAVSYTHLRAHET